MQRFINGDKTQYDWLRSQIQETTMIFNDVFLPTSCTPNRCRIGFEYTQANGYTLYIDKNITYAGDHKGFSALLSRGELSFYTYDDMIAFIVGLQCLFDADTETQNDPLSLTYSLISPLGNNMTFSFKYKKYFSLFHGTVWRAFIIDNPSYRSRSTLSCRTHRIGTITGKYYICWDRAVKELEQMIEISKMWAEVTARYIDTGERF